MELNVKEDCSNLNSLPDIKIDLDGKDFSLSPSEYVLKTKNMDEMDSSIPWDGTYQCAPAFMALDVPPPRGPIFIIGDTFLRKFYTVFDRNQNKIGFALAR